MSAAQIEDLCRASGYDWRLTVAFCVLVVAITVLVGQMWYVAVAAKVTTDDIQTREDKTNHNSLES